MNFLCPFCGVFHWQAEKIASTLVHRPEFLTCCQHGHVHLSLQTLPPYDLYTLFKTNDDDGKEFCMNICQYNMALAFTSLGVMEDKLVNHQGGWVFYVQGELCYRVSVQI